MRELVIGPKTVLVMSVPYSTPQTIDRARHFVIGSLEKAGIAIEHERIIAVERGVNFTTIEPVAEDDSVDDILHDLMETVGRSSDSITDPQGATLLDDRPVPLYDKETTWSYVRGAEQKMQELQAEIDRWKMVAEGGHALPTTDHLLDNVADLLQEAAFRGDADNARKENLVDACRQRAALLRSHLEAPKQG